MSGAEFDSFAAGYDEDLARGLALTGEGKDFYARRGIEWLAGRLADKRLAWVPKPSQSR